MEIGFCNLADTSLEGVRDALRAAFEDYLLPIEFSLDGADWLVRAQGVSLVRSRRVLVDGHAAGVGLVERRGLASRIVAFGINKPFRKMGIGKALLGRLIEDAGDAQEEAIWLESVHGNDGAIRLYENAGFRCVRRLVGWDAEFVAPRPGRVEEIALAEACRRIVRIAMPDAPWIVSGETLCRLGHPCRAFALGTAALIVQPLQSNALSIRGVTMARMPTMLQQLAEIVGHVASLYPRWRWQSGPFFPEDVLGETMAGLGFGLSNVVQGQYLLELQEGAS